MKENKISRRTVNKIGYKKDQQGIINRYLREMGQWDTHLYRCRKYILDSIKIYQPGIVTFMGSGWLLDIPLEEAAEICRTVNLVDIIHPSQVRHKVSGFKNVKLIEEDLTAGALEAIWQVYRNKLDVKNIEIPAYSPGYEAGMVFSVNLLTQLDSLPVDFLAKNTDADKHSLRKIRQGIQRAHINYLKKNDSVLITDYIEYLKKEDRIEEENKLLFTTLPGGRRKEEWTWEFDNSGNYYTGKKVIFGVKAIDMVKNQNGRD